MKLLHTADLHLGQCLHPYSRSAEHAHFLEWLLTQIKAEATDALIISGNLFDTPVPTAEAQRLFFDFLSQAVAENEGLQIVIIAGANQEGAWLESAATLLHRHNVYIRGQVQRNSIGEIDLEHLILPLAQRGETEAAMVCFALPFLRENDAPAGTSAEEALRQILRGMDKIHKKSDFAKLPVVLAAHFHADGTHGHSSRNIREVVNFAAIDGGYVYAALGGISEGQTVATKGEARYPGSPLALSFAEANDRRGVLAIDLGAGKLPQIHPLEYTPLCPLRAFPPQGTADIAAVKKWIAALPHRDHQPDERQWPYAEIHLRLSQPDDSLRRNLLDSLADKAVKVCRITTTDPQSTAQRSERLPALQATWKNITPLELARRVYRERFAEEMSPELVARFQQAEAALQH